MRYSSMKLSNLNIVLELKEAFMERFGGFTIVC